MTATPGSSAAPSRAAANWRRVAVHARPGVARAVAARRKQQEEAAAVAAEAEEAATPEEAAQLFGVGDAQSSPSIIERLTLRASGAAAQPRGTRVCVLIRCAYGMPRDARVYAKVSCGFATHKTHHITGVTSPHWSQLFTFDVDEPERAVLVFRCKHKRHLALTNEGLGRAALPLSEVSASPESYAEPHRLELVPEGLFASKPGTARELEVQVFMSSQGQMASLASSGGAVSVLAATWNVGNALPPPAAQLASLWLRGAGGSGEHHLVAVAAQECSYLRDARAIKGASSTQRRASEDLDAPLDTAAAPSPTNGSSGGQGQRQSSSGAGDGQAARPPSRSLRASQAAAAAGATEAADVGADEDDEEDAPPAEEGGKEGRARMSRAKSLKGMITQTIDSASAWETHIAEALGPKYWLVGSRHMFQTRILVYARMDVVPFITDVWTGFEATGIGRVGLNKGGVAVSLTVGATRLAFLGSHLAAHQSQCARRNHDVGEIIEELLPPGLGRANIVTGPDHVVWMGDLNYRLDWGKQAETLSETPTPEDHAAIVARVQSEAYRELLQTDQLAREMAAGRAFVGFTEAAIEFPPTFKVSKGVAGLSYGMKRSPAWCDRVLVRSNLPHRAAEAGSYYTCPSIATSDHKPVAATLRLPLVASPARSPGPRKPFRLYLCNARLVGGEGWDALAALVSKRGLVAGSNASLRLLVSGPALASGRKEHVVHLNMARLRAGLAATSGNAADLAAARGASVLRVEASMQLQPTTQALLRDSKLLLRLALQEGPCHLHTLALGVLPLNTAAEDFTARRFKPTAVNVTLETPQGARLGELRVEAQVFSSVRTRSVVLEAVRRMRMLAVASGARPARGGLAGRAVSASAATPTAHRPRSAPTLSAS
ncbi:inositol 5-phosphatase [Raphidocelis subcapitata]|uniref:Inositol 5-phosphatase n=1 Tax=Raphidocelis subcapitata TaxID=307507 RepID=A0A2V0P865_9CHLO|nr:inositol 5-phosphatase [Raphidocelis subcapitata]|eukprot:GBF95749.1 inositol 5-phosphatase [Raphidocelis subcapitata]